MSLKITVSYTEPREYGAVLRLLMPIIRTARKARGEKVGDGKYKRAYIVCDVAKKAKDQGKRRDIEKIVELLRGESAENVQEILVFAQNYRLK